MKADEKKQTKTGKTLSIILNVILWVFVAFAVLITVMVFSSQNNKDGLPSIGGKSIVAIVSDSMRPTFKAGDLIVINRLTDKQKESCQVGDIITFYSDLDDDGENELNTHRIQSIRKGQNGYIYYTTKGDNKATNPISDKSEVVYLNVCGRYENTKLTGVGTVISFLQTPTGFLCVIVLPLVLFFLFELYRFIVIIVSMKTKNKLSTEDEEAIKKKAVEEYLKSQQNADATDDSAKPQ